MNSTICDIISLDMMLGDLARDAEECYCENKYMAALACLFILSEQTIKMTLDVTEGNFKNLIDNACKECLISKNENDTLHSLREIRNKLFHESHYCYFLELNEIFYPLSEADTKKIIYEMYSDRCFKIIHKLICRNSLSNNL